MPVLRPERGDETIGIWSAGELGPDEVILELEPFTDDDPLVVATEQAIRDTFGGDP